MSEEVNAQIIEILRPEISELKIPFVGDIAAGFPSAAEDFVTNSIDLNELLIEHKESTFLARVKGRQWIMTLKIETCLSSTEVSSGRRTK